MKLNDRCCEVCGARADLTLTSAHHARVIFFCTGHGKAFKVLAFLWHGATREVSARIDFWLETKREFSAATRMSATASDLRC